MSNLDKAKMHLRMSLEKHWDDEFQHLLGRCDILLQEYDYETEDVKEELVGYIKFSLYHLVKYADEIEELIFEIDAESADKNKLVNEFLNFLVISDQFDSFLSFITINSFRIEKEYRNQNIGSKALKQFLDYGMYMNVDYFTLQPAPIEPLLSPETRINKIKQIAKFYEKSGFKCFQTEGEEPIMIHSDSCYLTPELFTSNINKIKYSHAKGDINDVPIIT